MLEKGNISYQTKYLSQPKYKYDVDIESSVGKIVIKLQKLLKIYKILQKGEQRQITQKQTKNNPSHKTSNKQIRIQTSKLKRCFLGQSSQQKHKIKMKEFMQRQICLKQQTRRPQLQIKLIQSADLYPFAIRQVKNFVQLSYTCLADRKIGKQILGIQVIGGYRKIKLVRKKTPLDLEPNQISNEDQKILHRQAINTQATKQYESNQDFLIVFILLVDGLDSGNSKSKDSIYEQEEHVSDRQQRQIQMDEMDEYFLGKSSKNKSRNPISNAFIQNPHHIKATNYLHVPYSIYKKLHDLNHEIVSLDKFHPFYDHSQLRVTIERFPISYDECLKPQSFDEQAQKITITNLKMPSNQAQSNQLKDLITKIIVHPKFQLQRTTKSTKETKINIKQFQFFIFPQNQDQRVFIDLSWLQECQFLNCLKRQSLKLKSKLLQLKRENDKSNKKILDRSSYRNYLEFTVSYQTKGTTNNIAQKVTIVKFIPGKTIIQFSNLNSFSNIKVQPFCKKIKLSSTYFQIYRQNAFYRNLKQKIIDCFRSQKRDTLICLKSDKSVGMSSFFHSLSQQLLNQRFLRVDCENFATLNQFFSKLKQTSCEGNCFLFIKNVNWLETLSKNQDIVPETMKYLIQKIYETLKKSFQNTFINFSCLLYFSQGQIPEELPRISKRWQLHIQKDQKLQILKQIFQNQKQIWKVDQKIEQNITNMLVNSVGWTKIYKFIKSLGKCIENMSEKQIVKTIQTKFSLQNVQNVAQVSWDDIGGLQTAKQQIIQTVLLPTKHPEIFDQWIKPRTGLLFYGPPGTGKTLLGKCIAKECKMSFISVKGPQLLNMYVGQSEKNVRQIFQRAKQSKPCIVFMDELDALIPKRGNSSDSNSVMDRIVAELLTQMDMASENQIFIIGATNRPDLLDPSILRAGRFDKQIYLGISRKKEDRVKILKAQTRNTKLSKDFDFEMIIEKVPQNFTGADFYGLTSKAMMRAVQRSIQKFEKGEDLNPQVLITEGDFLDVVLTVKSSVSQAQLQHYQTLKQKFS